MLTQVLNLQIAHAQQDQAVKADTKANKLRAKVEAEGESIDTSMDVKTTRNAHQSTGHGNGPRGPF